MEKEGFNIFVIHEHGSSPDTRAGSFARSFGGPAIWLQIPQNLGALYNLDLLLTGLGKPYYANMCRICSKYARKRCGACDTFAYCSKEHQALDWVDHQKLCRILSFFNFRYKVGCSFEEFKLTGEMYRNRILTRCLSLSPREKTLLKHVFLSPIICAICYSKNNLFECPHCLSVWYCSSEHQEQDAVQHQIYCSSLELRRSLDSLDDEFEKVELANLIDNRIKHLPKKTRDFVRIFKKCNSTFGPETLREFLVSTIWGDHLSIGTTILFVLERLGLMQSRNLVKTELLIHLVEFTDNENNVNWYFLVYILLRWIKNAEKIQIIVFDPKILRSRTLKVSTQDFKSATIIFLPKLLNYVYLKENPDYAFLKEKPDIMVAFDCNFETVYKTHLACLLHNKDVPLLVTHPIYNEMQKTFKFLNLFCSRIKVIMPPQKNPFAGLIPLKVSMFHDGYLKVLFNHAYLMVLIIET